MHFFHFTSGALFYGKTLRLGDAIWIRTRFLHFMLFPLVPRSSRLFLSRAARDAWGISDESILLPSLDWRSALLGWGRAVVILFFLLACLALTTQLLLDRSLEAMAPTLCSLAGAVVTYWLSFRLDRTSPERLEQVLAHRGLPDVLYRQAAQLAS